MSKIINERTTKYINHKTETLIERVYLAIVDKVFDAENNDDFEIDSDNNIYIVYCLKRDEAIISDAHELIADQIKRKYRKKLQEQLEEETYYVEYDDSDIHVYFEKPLKTDNKTDTSLSSIEHNLLKYKKKGEQPKIITGKILTGSDDSGIFDFGCGDEN